MRWLHGCTSNAVETRRCTRHCLPMRICHTTTGCIIVNIAKMDEDFAPLLCLERGRFPWEIAEGYEEPKFLC